MESVLCVLVLDSHRCDIQFVSVMDVMPHGTVDRYSTYVLPQWVVGRPEKCHIKGIPFKWRMCVHKK